MKSVLLLTYRNTYLSRYFSDKGYLPVPYQLPLKLSDWEKITDSPEAEYIVAEVNELNIEDISEILNKVSQSKKIICIADSVSGKIKETLFNCGVTDLIGVRNAAGLPDYIDAVKKRSSSKLGKILILEDSEITKRMLNEIIGRFDYEPVFITSIDRLIENLNNNNIQIVLLNLGIEGLNLVKLIAMYNSHPGLKKYPVISYKDMNTGIFVHEIISGLNRLTRVILSKEELFSFLVDVLFRKKIIPAIDRMNKSADFSDTSFFREETLSKLYNNRSGFLFSMTNILSDQNIDIMRGTLEEIKGNLKKISGLKWLIIDRSRENSNQRSG